MFVLCCEVVSKLYRLLCQEATGTHPVPLIKRPPCPLLSIGVIFQGRHAGAGNAEHLRLVVRLRLVVAHQVALTAMMIP